MALVATARREGAAAPIAGNGSRKRTCVFWGAFSTGMRLHYCRLIIAQRRGSDGRWACYAKSHSVRTFLPPRRRQRRSGAFHVRVSTWPLLSRRRRQPRTAPCTSLSARSAIRGQIDAPRSGENCPGAHREARPVVRGREGFCMEDRIRCWLAAASGDAAEQATCDSAGVSCTHIMKRVSARLVGAEIRERGGGRRGLLHLHRL